MKLNNIIYAMFALSLMATSCSQDEEGYVSQSEQSAITITVTDLGMTSGDTRATTSGLKTTFANGDQIGLYAVYNGAVVSKCNNLPITKTADGWTGLDASMKFEKGTQFYAYYPYSASTTGFSASEGFTKIIDNWNPTTATTYAAADLMTSAATEIAKEDGKPQSTLTLALTHAMSMVEISTSSAGDVVYTFTNDGITDTYTASKGASSAPTIKLGSTTISNYAEVSGKYRVLVNPKTSSTLAVTYGGKTYSPKSTPSWAAGAYFTMQVGETGSTTEKEWTLEVGDIMLSDGTLAKAADLTSAEKAEAIGIVYYVGNPSPLYLYASSYSKYPSCNALPSTCTHGLVISISDMSIEGNVWGTTAWEGSDFKTLYDDRESNGVLAECSSTNVTKRILGYDNLAVFKKLGDKYSTLVSALAGKSAPSSSSGWYVPSYPEVTLIYSGALSKAAGSSSDPGYNLACSADNMSAALTALGMTTLWAEGTIYMTSTLEFSSNKVTGKVYGFSDGAFSKYTLSSSDLTYVIRPALAF